MSTISVKYSTFYLIKIRLNTYLYKVIALITTYLKVCYEIMAHSSKDNQNNSPNPLTENVGSIQVTRGEFDYLPPPDPFYVQEGLKEKLIAKTKENPFVPLGVIFTTVVLGIGISTMRSGDGRKAQLLMRLRVGGQAFAVLALLGGVYLKANSSKQD